MRDPRRLPRSWWLAAARARCWPPPRPSLVWLWRRRRRAGPDGADEPLPLPAWLQAARDLDVLLAERLLERGDGRAFLHRLDVVFRRYLAARYRFAALRDDGHRGGRRPWTPCGTRTAPPRRRRRSSGRCDELRFAPAAALPADGRGLLAPGGRARSHARREPIRYTPVPPAVLIESERCWERVLAAAAARERRSARA